MHRALTDPPDAHWEQFAASEPYFAVLTAPRFLRANLTPAAEREFFASGEHIVSWLLNVADAGLLPQFAPMSVLEYGCGAGRLALPLAARFGSVTAVDRSPAMLAFAREEAVRRGLHHLTLQTPSELFTSNRTFDLIVCYQVLQRLDPRVGLTLVEALVDRLGPNGIAVFQWPTRTNESALVELSRWAREHVPGANAAANLLRQTPAAGPFVATHTYALESVLALFDRAVFRTIHVAFEQEDRLSTAVLFAHRPDRSPAVNSHQLRETGGASKGTQPSGSPGSSAPDASPDEIARFNQAAEVYFSSLDSWDHHLAKPFSKVEETPAILASLAVVLQALQLVPGHRVLEFGGGSGWLSRFLTQMGCRVVLLDVSNTALAMARDLYRRQPVIGTSPEPEFLLFDGLRIDLPDASIDRILCFDAFHHAANPEAVIREFGRVLAPGGIAAFAEPGPRHSDAPRSQFEMHTYGVVERDVDVHAIWRAAQEAGFSELKMSVFNGAPHQVSLREFEGLLAGGVESGAWLSSTRAFLRYVRNFSLIKAGTPRLDSRGLDGLACDVRAALMNVPDASTPAIMDVTVVNTGQATWLPSNEKPGGVAIGVHLYDGTGRLLTFDFHWEATADPGAEVPPGGIVHRRMTLPLLASGAYRVEIDCVAAGVAWFAQAGSRPVRLAMAILDSPFKGK